MTLQLLDADALAASLPDEAILDLKRAIRAFAELGQALLAWAKRVFAGLRAWVKLEARSIRHFLGKKALPRRFTQTWWYVLDDSGERCYFHTANKAKKRMPNRRIYKELHRYL